MNKKTIAVALMLLVLGAVNVFPAEVYAEDNFSKKDVVSNEAETVQDVSELNYPEGTAVYYNGSYYKTLAEALRAVYMDTETTGVKEVYCKAGEDVGAMTHGHVADDLVIYGNGAYVSSGERDLEIDTFKYNRQTGNQDANGAYLEKEITVTVKNLNGIAAWGQRHTNHTFNLNFENCKNMQRIYFTGQTGDININVEGCSFDGESETLKANKDTAIYSNANGSININNTTFNNIDVALNLNHKMKGTQTVAIKNSEFINCGQGTDTNKEYAAPVRIVAQVGATTNLSVENTKFTYSEGIANCGNGDILLGDGRSGLSSILATGTTTLEMKDTKAQVMVQKAGYHSNGTTNPDKAVITEVEASDVVLPSDDNHFEVDNHESVKVVDKKEATCTEEGYTGDKVCEKCGMVLEKGQAISKLPHDFKWVVDKAATETENGSKHEECSVCGYKKESVEIPALTPTNPDKPSVDKPSADKPDPDKTGTNTTSSAKESVKTGDQANISLFISLFAMSAACVIAVAVWKRKKTLENR